MPSVRHNSVSLTYMSLYTSQCVLNCLSTWPVHLVHVNVCMCASFQFLCMCTVEGQISILLTPTALLGGALVRFELDELFGHVIVVAL